MLFNFFGLSFSLLTTTAHHWPNPSVRLSVCLPLCVSVRPCIWCCSCCCCCWLLISPAGAMLLYMACPHKNIERKKRIQSVAKAKLLVRMRTAILYKPIPNWGPLIAIKHISAASSWKAGDLHPFPSWVHQWNSNWRNERATEPFFFFFFFKPPRHPPTAVRPRSSNLVFLPFFRIT